MAEKYIVEGYEFDTIEDANIAKKELEAVRFMSQKTDGCTPEVAFKIYNKIIQGNLFKTAIGYDYLRSLESFLVESKILGASEDYGFDEDVESSELAGDFKMQNQQVEEAQIDPDSIDFLKANDTGKAGEEESLEVVKAQLKKTRAKLSTSIFVNVVLAVMVGVMLYIASTSSSVNIINYETALQDKYSGWAEELKVKEQELNEREKALEELEKSR